MTTVKLTDFMPSEIQEVHTMTMTDGRKLMFRPPSSFTPPELVLWASVHEELQQAAKAVSEGDMAAPAQYRAAYARLIQIILPDMTAEDVAPLNVNALIGIMRWYNKAYGLEKKTTIPKPKRPLKPKRTAPPTPAKSALPS